jgi:hypothetical protein
MREISATLRFHHPPAKSHRVWLKRPDPGPGPAGIADPLFATLLISAMALGEELRIEGPVSAPLIDAVRKQLIPVLLRWHPRLRQIPLEIESVTPVSSTADGGAVACFFSGGVDSWYSLAGSRDSISHLVHIHGFEIAASEEAIWRRAHEEVREIARQHDKRLIPVSTNFMDVALRAVRDRMRRSGAPWPTFGIDAWYGSMLVAVGLSLRPGLHRLIIPASWSERTTYPIASHPMMEPAWSTDGLKIELHGFEVDRLGKIRSLAASSPEAFSRMRVCIDDQHRSEGFLNCGRCVKCVRTMLEFRVCGVSGYESLFRHPIDLPWAMRQRFPGDAGIWRSLGEEAAAIGDLEVSEAVRVVLDERPHLPRMFADVERALRRRSLRELHLPRWRHRKRSGRDA